jgi:6,7-dimethyl-8-ribityllumazine synthase
MMGTSELPPPHVLIVEARFYAEIADEMTRGAMQALEAAGATHERLSVPGAFEIPGLIAMALEAQRRDPSRRPFDGFVALGCVVRGETTHYDYVCGESARGLMDLACRHQIALGYGILTVENGKQAWARARVAEKNKGGDAAEACLAMIRHKRDFGLPTR